MNRPSRKDGSENKPEAEVHSGYAAGQRPSSEWLKKNKIKALEWLSQSPELGRGGVTLNGHFILENPSVEQTIGRGVGQTVSTAT